jgi:phosphonate degradation associated HDIG domain protein
VSVPRSVDEILSLYDERGAENYGEGVDMTSHALQCAMLAQADDATPALVAAALLHDIGHLVADLPGDTPRDLALEDDRHEAVGARVLAPLFGPGVAQPVALHVTAKRYRCATDPEYHDHLTPASRASLLVQGGPLEERECQRFLAHPGFAAAMALRQWDDLAKIPDCPTPPMATFRPLLVRLASTVPG